jgi:hypothetical protein
MARETTGANGVELTRQVRAVAGFRALAFELTPLICTILVLWFKQVYFALAQSQMGGLISSSLPEQANYLVLLTATLSTIIVPVALIALLPRVPRLVALFCLDLIYTTLILADIISIRFYGEILSFMGVTPFRMIRTVLPSIRAQLVRADALLYIDLVAALVLLPFYLRESRRFPHLYQLGYANSQVPRRR